MFGFPGLYARTIELYTCRVYARASGCQDERQFPSRRLWGSRKMLSRDQAFIQSQQVDRVGPLTVGVAHDLNNLLAIIAGNLETLAQRIGNKNPMQCQVQAAPLAVHRGARLALCSNTGRKGSQLTGQSAGRSPPDIRCYPTRGSGIPLHPGSIQPTRWVGLRRLPGRRTSVHSPSASWPHLQE